MTRDEIIHILRNPYGHSALRVRQARVQGAALVECLIARLEFAGEALNYANQNLSEIDGEDDVTEEALKACNLNHVYEENKWDKMVAEIRKSVESRPDWMKQTKRVNKL